MSKSYSDKIMATRRPEIPAKFIAAVIFLFLTCGLYAQVKETEATAGGRKEKRESKKIGGIIVDDMPETYADSLVKNTTINDYTMIGFQYGMSMNNVMWNPAMKQKYLFLPVNFGITYTRYGKMFGYMPHFGIQVGLFYTNEGYQFKEDKETGYTPTLEGATKAVMQVVEVPVLAHMHFDFWKMKMIANIGFFGGYRLGIERFGEYVSEEDAHSFMEYDRRFDYGIKGGLGFGFIFDPVEIHFQAMYKYSMSTIYEPDYSSQYYYKYAYPNSIVFSVGLHFQLTKRTGKTRHSIRQEAKRALGIGVDLQEIQGKQEMQKTPESAGAKNQNKPLQTELE